MAFFRGTATNYLDLIDELEAIATEESIATAVIAAGGTGYTVGDVIVASGGTATHAAEFIVTSVSGGAITGLRIWNAGAYSATPSSPVAVTGPGNDDATVTVTFAETGWEVMRSETNVFLLNITLQTGGTGYTVNDVLTISGGTFTTAATITVTAVSGGVITAVSITTRGNYSVAPTGTLAVTGPGDDNATFTAQFAGTNGRQELILKGTGSGFDEIYVGLRSYNNVGTDAHNWDLAGMTGFDPTLAFMQQPGVSPGQFELPTDGGAVLTLANSSIDYYMAISPRRIFVGGVISGGFFSCYMGLLAPFATSLEFPYPLVIMGCTSDHLDKFSDTTGALSSPVDPIATSGAHNGPGVVRLPNGAWNTIQNRSAVGSAAFSMLVYPAGKPISSNLPSTLLLLDADEIVDEGTLPWQAIIPNSGTPGTQTVRLKRTPDSGGDITLLVPTMIINATFDSQNHIIGQGILGELEGLYWISAEGGIISEDSLSFGDFFYRLFKSGNRGELFSFFAVKEA